MHDTYPHLLRDDVGREAIVPLYLVTEIRELVRVLPGGCKPVAIPNKVTGVLPYLFTWNGYAVTLGVPRGGRNLFLTFLINAQPLTGDT